MIPLKERFSNYKRQFDRYLVNRQIAAFNRYNRASHRFSDFSEHLIIAGEPRGGTTWLMELLKEENDAVIWEPLQIERLQQHPVSGFYRDIGLVPYVPEGTAWEPAYTFFNDLLQGHLPLGLEHNFQQGGHGLKDKDRLLFKFCRANMILPWLTSAFPGIKPIYLVRHPLAVISSQLNFPPWEKFGPTNSFFDMHQSRFSDIFDQYSHLRNSINSRTALFANWWAIRNVLPYSHAGKRWLTVSYERLYLHPQEELDRIAAWLGETFPDEVYARVKIPSATTQPGSAILENGNQLANWRKYLSKDQVDEILGIVHAYGITAYSDSLEPDYKLLGY
jgi:hypothetical protein